MANSIRLPWWEAGDAVQRFQLSIAEAQEQLRSMPSAARVKLEARAFVSTVMVACEAEIMSGRILSAKAAFRVLTRLYHGLLAACPPDSPHVDLRYFYHCDHAWPWQPYFLRHSNLINHGKAALLAQMKQHLKALMYLCIYNKNEPLTASLLTSTHAILMRGFQDFPEDRIAIPNGQFRNCIMNLDGAVVVHESSIGSSVTDMLCRLQREADTPVPAGISSPTFFNFVERCATLLHDMSHIRPFVHGNDCMCRMIMAFSMVTQCGFAFPVPVAPVTTRTTDEFLEAFLTPDNARIQLQADIADGFRREKALLSAYILECVWESLEDIMSYSQ